MTLYYQFDLFILFWHRALSLDKSQFDKKLSKFNFNIIPLFKIHVSIYNLIDLLSLYLNILISFIFNCTFW
jgi:hypothetical protein